MLRKTKYMFMSADQHAGQSHSIKTSNKPSERVEQFKYLGTTLTYKNPIHIEIKIELKTGNACYQTKIHKTVILPVVLYGCDLVCYTEGGSEAEGVSEQDALLLIK